MWRDTGGTNTAGYLSSTYTGTYPATVSLTAQSNLYSIYATYDAYDPYFYNITFWDDATTVSYGLGRSFNGSFAVGGLDKNARFNVSIFWYEGDATPDTVIISNNTAGSNMSNYTNAQINGSMKYIHWNLTSENYRVGYNYSLGIYACDSDRGCNS